MEAGEFRYELAADWGELPDGYEWHQVAGVAVDSADNVYAYNRSAHQVMVFRQRRQVPERVGRDVRRPARHPHRAGRQRLSRRPRRAPRQEVHDGRQRAAPHRHRRAVRHGLRVQRRTRGARGGSVQPADRRRSLRTRATCSSRTATATAASTATTPQGRSYSRGGCPAR